MSRNNFTNKVVYIFPRHIPEILMCTNYKANSCYMYVNRMPDYYFAVKITSQILCF